MSSERYGQFELVKKLATGGMAQIYLARHRGIEGFERLCVVKRILPHLAENEDFVQMFLDEAKIAARLNHPNIVQIYDLGEQDGSFYIAMEYIHGEDLRRVWRRAEQQGGSLPVPVVLRVIADAASGLDYAHKRSDGGRPLNIVHRDISPQNILVSFEGTVKVVDFGIAKAVDKATHTRSGVLKGKYSYMSPEQATGSRDVDARTDIFALGVVLYELLTGTRLFKRNNDVQTLQAVMACQVVPPSQVSPRVPRSLDEVVLRALTQSPEDRYQDALSFQLAVENWLIENQQPASTAHVAAYLKELYAERLAQEAPHGTPIAEDIRTPSSRAGRSPTGGGRFAGGSSAGPSAVPVDLTTHQRPERPSRSHVRASRGHPTGPRGGSSARPHPELPAETSPRVTEVSRTGGGTPKRSSSSSSSSSSSKAVRVGAAVAVLALLGVGVWWMSVGGGAPLAQVTVLTDPPGARLTWDGAPVVQPTPTVLPPRPEGAYALRITREGFREELVSVTVPATGAIEVGPVRLAPLSPAVSISGNEPAAPVKVEVAVELVTDPPGAALTVNGRAEGLAPVTVKVPPGTELSVRAELAGHLPAERNIVAGEAGGRELVAKLERRRGGGGGSSAQAAASAGQGAGSGGTVAAAGTRNQDGAGAGPGANTNSGPGSGSGSSVAARGAGSVLFVVLPLGERAEFSCNGSAFKDVPFEAIQLSAGAHDCTFRHPVHGPIRKTVYVRPGQDIQREPVRFN